MEGGYSRCSSECAFVDFPGLQGKWLYFQPGVHVLGRRGEEKIGVSHRHDPANVSFPTFLLVAPLTKIQRDIRNCIPIEPVPDHGRFLGSRSVWYFAIDCVPLVLHLCTTVSSWILLRCEAWGRHGDRQAALTANQPSCRELTIRFESTQYHDKSRRNPNTWNLGYGMH